jgi:hypothetical protein
MSASLFYLPFRPAISPTALCLEPGALLYFYETGGTTLAPVYTTDALSTELTNPVEANAAGVWPSIYLDTDNVTYRVVLKDADGVTLNDADPYLPNVVDSLTTDLQAIVDQVSGYADAVGFQVSLAYSSYTALAAVTGTAGQSAAVFNDGGTHTDPVVGGTVSNTGIYGYSVSPAGWERLSDLGSVTLTGSETLSNKTLVDPVITGAIKEDVYAISDGAAFEIDPGNGTIQTITLGASRTPKATNFAAGESVTLMVNDGSAYTLTWTDATFGGSGVSWVGGSSGGGSAPTLGTTGYTVITLWKVGTQVYGMLAGYTA